MGSAVSTTLKRLCRRPAEQQEAATRLVQAFELQADEWQGEVPLWHGWAIHQAFLLGIEYAERQREEERRAA